MQGMDNHGWTDAKKTPPTRKDADAAGCVLVWHEYNGTMIAGWHQVEKNAFLLYWRPMPPPPQGFEIWQAK